MADLDGSKRGPSNICDEFVNFLRIAEVYAELKTTFLSVPISPGLKPSAAALATMTISIFTFTNPTTTL